MVSNKTYLTSFSGASFLEENNIIMVASPVAMCICTCAHYEDLLRGLEA